MLNWQLTINTAPTHERSAGLNTPGGLMISAAVQTESIGQYLWTMAGLANREPRRRGLSSTGLDVIDERLAEYADPLVRKG